MSGNKIGKIRSYGFIPENPSSQPKEDVEAYQVVGADLDSQFPVL